MDPVSGAASIITLVVLSKSIIQIGRKYVKDFRDAPVILSRFCDELEALTVLSDHLLIFQRQTQNVPSCRAGALTEILRRTPLLKEYECQLKKLETKLSQISLRSPKRRLLFPLYEHQILNGLNVVHKIQSIFESALSIDDSFYTQSIHHEIQRINTALQTNHHQLLIDNSKTDARFNELIIALHDKPSYTELTPTFRITGTRQVRDPGYLRTQVRRVSNRTLTKHVLDLLFGKVSICNESSMESLKNQRTGYKAQPSRFAIIFFPSPMFWQIMIYFRLEWAIRLNSLMVPNFSLQFLDIVQDDHPIISASRQGDTHILKSILANQKISPLCSTTAGWTPLHFAAAYGQTDTCRYLMVEGVPIDATGYRGITPLHLAAHFGRFEVFKTLFKAGSEPDDYHENGMNAVMEILSNERMSDSPDQTEFLKWLLIWQDQFLLDVQARDNSERTILDSLAYPPGWADRSNHTLTIDQSEAIKSILRQGIKGDELDINGVSILHMACADNRLDLVELLLSAKCNINVTASDGESPLFNAIRSGNVELVSTLIKHGSDINFVARDYYGNLRCCSTPLHIAARMNSVEMISFLIQHGANSYDEYVATIFDGAVCCGSLETVQYLINNNIHQLDLRGKFIRAQDNEDMIDILYKAGTPLDYESEGGFVALAWAARCGYHRAVKKLIELGASLDKLMDDLTPLGHAVARGNNDIIYMLLAAGAKVNLTGYQMPTPYQLAIKVGCYKIADDTAHYTATSHSSTLIDTPIIGLAEDEIDAPEAAPRKERDLTTAAWHGDLIAAERLIKEGCDLEFGESYHHWSPLSLAICNGHWAVAEKLVQAGAELNDGDRTPLMDAVRRNNVAFIKMIIRNGADVNLSSDDGSTALLLSLDLYWCSFCPSAPMCYSNGEIVQTLLSAGANVNAIDNFGRTALGNAAAIGNFEAVVKLVEAGADLNRPSSQNSEYSRVEYSSELFFRLPLAWAASKGHKKVAKFLLDSGAEWKSIRNEPAVLPIHRLLMQSWFPGETEASANEVHYVEIPSISSAYSTKNHRGRSFNDNSREVTPNLKSDPSRGHYTSISHYTSLARKFYTTMMSRVRSLSQRIRAIYDRLQLIRIEAVAFILISLLILVRASFRYFTTPRLATTKPLILSILTGMFLASWIKQSTT